MLKALKGETRSERRKILSDIVYIGDMENIKVEELAYIINFKIGG